MSEETFSIRVPTDEDGYVTFQCPFCSSLFKLMVEEFERDSVWDFYCPCCGLKDGSASFLPDKIHEQSEIIAMNYMRELINNSMKNLERDFRSYPHVSFSSGSPMEIEPEKLLYEQELMRSFTLACCKMSVKLKHEMIDLPRYCPYCGVG